MDVRIYMSSGKSIQLEIYDMDDFWEDLCFDNGVPLNCFVEIVKDVWISPSQIASVDVIE